MTATEPKTILIHAVHESQYDVVVQPERFIGVPKYFLRHIPRLGADLAWTYLAFRQAAYETGVRKLSASGRFSGAQIAAWSGSVPRTFWNRIAKPETWEKLAGLVQILRDPEIQWQEAGDWLRREPNRYTVSMTLPLTPADAASLRIWLTRAAETHGADTALRLAIETPLADLFACSGEESQTSQSAFAIAQEMFYNAIPESRLGKMARDLQVHVMGQRLEISHFFVRHVLPYLGTGAGLLWLLLRERADAGGRVTVPGGYAEMASWLGLNRPKTIWDWMHGTITAKRQSSHKASSNKIRTGGREAAPLGSLRNPILPLYVQETSQGRTGQNFDNASRSFKILLDDIPAALLDVPVEMELDELGSWLHEQQLLARFAYPVGAVCTPLLAQFAQDIGAVCTVFKSTPPPDTFASAKEESADTKNIPPYPQSLAEAMTHPDIQLYQSITDCYPEQKDLEYTVNYVANLRQRQPDLSDVELAEQGAKYFTEWSGRGYAHTNPEWLHWWVNQYTPPTPRKRQRKSSPSQPVRSMPTAPEPERVLTPKELELSLAASKVSRKHLEGLGILQPGIH